MTMLREFVAVMGTALAIGLVAELVLRHRDARIRRTRREALRTRLIPPSGPLADEQVIHALKTGERHPAMTTLQRRATGQPGHRQTSGASVTEHVAMLPSRPLVSINGGRR